MASQIDTRILIISDTHAGDFQDLRYVAADVVIHCGDLTEESQLHEYESSLNLLKSLSAPLKIVIPGNHDFTLDDTAYRRVRSGTVVSEQDIESCYGRIGQVQAIFDEARAHGIFLLNEGVHAIPLPNGALLNVYASPFTPSNSREGSGWGFQYYHGDDHTWNIPNGIDIAITHCPPYGVLDMTGNRQRAGSPSLFAAVAQARPRIHAFGHIHEAWGAKLVRWRGEHEILPRAQLSHFNAIENDESRRYESLATIRAGKFDGLEELQEKQGRYEELKSKGYCAVERGVEKGKETLFVNAALEGDGETRGPLPWVVSVALPRAE